jgi:nucleoside-diphosphate-sugar epimerase
MRISIIGTNGLLSDSIGRYCNRNNIQLDMYGLSAPEKHKYNNFYKVNLVNEQLSFNTIIKTDMIIYAVGGGIQSNLNESSDLIYKLNVSIPVSVCNNLKSLNYTGAFISFGSYFEIGENSDNKFFTEQELVQSQNKVVNDYSVSKRMFSRYISSISLPFKTLHFILPTIYGENESKHRLIPYTINALKSNSDIEFTSGEQVRQYIYIDEIAEIIIRALHKNITSGVYNVEGVETLSVKDLVKILFSAFNTTIPETVFGKTHRVDTGMKILQIEGAKLYNAINYQPNIKISEVYDRY